MQCLDVTVVNIHVVDLLLFLKLMVDTFLKLVNTLILIEDQLMLFLFYLVRRTIEAYNMVVKLVDF